MGGVFGLTTDATSTPALSGQYGKSAVRTGRAHPFESLLRSIQNCMFGVYLDQAILLDQWIEDQTTVDAPQYGPVR